MYGVLLNLLLLPLLCRSWEDASDVTWGHAINSRKELEDALRSSLDFLEADVSLGSAGGENGIPIMSHPPSTESDISLEQWIDTVINQNSAKGIKLDFKSTEIFEPALKILDKRRTKLTFPLWLNADILPGPGNASAKPVDAKSFLTLAQTYFPNVTLSLGWTTDLGPDVTRYTWTEIAKMARVLRCQNITQPITFPVRAVFVKESVPQFVWLYNAVPKSTFTVWSHITDPLQVSDLLELRKSLPASQVYYDLPGTQNKDFQDIKNQVTWQKNEVENLKLNILPNSLFNCETQTILGGNSIVYGGEGPVSIIHPLVKNNVDVSGTFYPCDSQGACASTTDSKFTVKISDSPDYWSSDAWANQGNDFLTVFTSNPSQGSSCNISFRVTITISGTDDHYQNTRVNTSGPCAVRSQSSQFVKPNSSMYVGVVIEGSRPIVIEKLTVATKSGGTTLSCFFMSVLCAIFISLSSC